MLKYFSQELSEAVQGEDDSCALNTVVSQGMMVTHGNPR